MPFKNYILIASIVILFLSLIVWTCFDSNSMGTEISDDVKYVKPIETAIDIENEIELQTAIAKYISRDVAEELHRILRQADDSDSGGLIISKELADAWRKKSLTSYDFLTDYEKDTYLGRARKYMHRLKEFCDIKCQGTIFH